MIYGTVEHGFKEGGSDGKDLADRALVEPQPKERVDWFRRLKDEVLLGTFS